MAITATYTVTLSASDKDHARGEYVYASIVRTSPATLVPEGLYVQSATINMAGAAVTITVMAMQAANTVGLTVDIPTAVILSALAAVSACGASGVPGGSLLLIPLACSLFGIPNDVAMQVVAIGFIIGVIQDSCETALNSSSDAVFTATAEYRTWIKKGRDFVMGKNNTPMA